MALEALTASAHEVVGVLTKPDAPAGRGRSLRASSVSESAHRHGLTVHTPHQLIDVLPLLKDLQPDAVAVVAYGLLVPPELLEVPTHGWVNAHFSLLPRWRGAAPVQHAIAAGDTTTGVTTFRINRGLDTGPILATSQEVAIRERDDSGHLLDRLAPIGAHLLVNTLDALAVGGVTASPQPGEGASLAPRLTVEQARIDWSASAREVDRWIRACTPAPGAWTTCAGERLRIGTPLGIRVGESPDVGRLVVEGSVVLVSAGEGFVELDQVQPQGKKWMPADAWIRGLRIEDPHVA